MYLSNKTNYEKFIFLRKEYSEFIFESFDYSFKDDGLHIVFEFSVDQKHHFSPSLLYPYNSHFTPKLKIEIEELNTLIFNMGMIELISYWKAICPKKIIVKPYKLTQSQIEFWKKIYYHGLGEFFYLNSIKTNIEDFVEISPEAENLAPKVEFIMSETEMIPIGGGKDSVVSLELIKGMKKDAVPLIMNPRGASLNSAYAAGYKDEDIIFIYRKIDKHLLELNSQGYLNGHTPFSAMLAFSGLIAGKLCNIPNMALSNESSANESTIAGEDINHQYSKTIEFESDFRNYVKENISEIFNYYSLLRPLSELQIAALFSLESKYNRVFRSCNVGSKTDSWCGKCPKCLFTFIMMSPFLTISELEQIFGKNLFQDKELLEYFKELSGISENKPFECVGTVDEVNIALAYTAQFVYKKDKIPYLLDYYLKTDKFKTFKNIDLNKALEQFDNEHFLNNSNFNFIKERLQWASSKR